MVGSGKLLVTSTAQSFLFPGSAGRMAIFLCLMTDWVVRITYLLVGRSGKSQLVLASTVIVGSESRRTHDHIFVPKDSESRATSQPVCVSAVSLELSLTVPCRVALQSVRPELFWTDSFDSSQAKYCIVAKIGEFTHLHSGGSFVIVFLLLSHSCRNRKST
jgi:hypothetical protein